MKKIILGLVALGLSSSYRNLDKNLGQIGGGIEK
jgi:hypothetical protein